MTKLKQVGKVWLIGWVLWMILTGLAIMATANRFQDDQRNTLKVGELLVDGEFVCSAFRFGDNIITAKHCLIADEMVYNDGSYVATLTIEDFTKTKGDVAYTKRLPKMSAVGRFVEVRHTVLGKELRHRAEVVFVGKAKELHRIVDQLYWLTPETEIILAKGISVGGMSGAPVLSNNRLVGVMSGGGAGFLIIVRG